MDLPLNPLKVKPLTSRQSKVDFSFASTFGSVAGLLALSSHMCSFFLLVAVIMFSPGKYQTRLLYSLLEEFVFAWDHPGPSDEEHKLGPWADSKGSHGAVQLLHEGLDFSYMKPLRQDVPTRAMTHPC